MKSVPPAVAGGFFHFMPRSLHLSIYRPGQHRLTVPQWIIIVPSVWNDTDNPLAYLISFRSYGTWLHGDKRGSIDRFNNHYKSPYIAPNKNWLRHNEQGLRADPLILQAEHRTRIEAAIRETCHIRNWTLLAINVRTKWNSLPLTNA